MATERSLPSTVLSSRKNVTRGRRRSASFGLCSSMLNGPRTPPKTVTTWSTTPWWAAGTSDLPVMAGMRGMGRSFRGRSGNQGFFGQPGQHVEVVRKRLGHAARVDDADARRAQAGHREAHRDAVVVVGLHVGRPRRAGMDGHRVPSAVYAQAHALELGGGGDRPVA